MDRRALLLDASTRGGSAPPLPPLLPWRGAFVIPDVFTDIPLGDGKRIWTPAFGCYGPDWQAKIIAAFRQRGYTHFVYNCAGQIYHDDYGYLPDDPARVRRDLVTLRNAGLIPVVCACDDADGGNVHPWASFTANADLIPIAFPAWECNAFWGVAEQQPDGSFAGPIIDAMRNVRTAAPKAKLYYHFTAGHGAPGSPERASWRYVRDAFKCSGLLSQDEGYVRNVQTADPDGTGAGLADTAQRLGEEGLENVAFEQITYPTYNKATRSEWHHYDEAFQRDYGARLMQLAPKTAGFCDGGR